MMWKCEEMRIKLTKLQVRGEIEVQERVRRRGLVGGGWKGRGIWLHRRRLIVGVLARLMIIKLRVGEEREVVVGDVERFVLQRLLHVEVAQVLRDVDAPVSGHDDLVSSLKMLVGFGVKCWVIRQEFAALWRN